MTNFENITLSIKTNFENITLSIKTNFALNLKAFFNMISDSI